MTYEYYDNHNVKTATAATGEVYEFFYDTYGNNTEVKVTKDGYTIRSTATYTTDGNRLASTTDALGKTTTYDYDENTNVLNWVRYPNDTDNTRTEYEYDEMYRLSEVLQNVSGSGNTLSAFYSYDEDLLTDLETATTSYTFTYGAFSQISSIKAGDKTLANYTYTDDADRYLHQLSYGNGHSIIYDYDNLGRLVQEVFKIGNSTIGTNTYRYNDLGEVAAIIDTVSGITTTYQRDFIGRLVAYEERSDDYFHRAAYGYDTKNNLTQLSDTVLDTVYTSEYTYDSNTNRISKVTDGLLEKTYGYDGFSRPNVTETFHGSSRVLAQTDTYVTGYIADVGNVTTGQVRTGRLDEVSEKEYTYYYNGSLLRVMTVDGVQQDPHPTKQNKSPINKWPPEMGGPVIKVKPLCFV